MYRIWISAWSVTVLTMDFRGFPQHPQVNVTTGEVHFRTGSEAAADDQRSNSAPSITSTLDGVGGYSSDRFTPEKVIRYPFYRRLCRPQDRCGRMRKISPPRTGIRSSYRPAPRDSQYRLSYPGPQCHESWSNYILTASFQLPSNLSFLHLTGIQG